MKEFYSQQDLLDFVPRHEVFIGLDSDGCVFDSMTVKQRIFHDGIIRMWGLEAAEDDVRRICEWVGLYSPWRGLNRFQLLLKIFQTLGNCVAAQGFASQGQSDFQCLEKLSAEFPDIGKTLPIAALERFIESGVPLSMAELDKCRDAGLQDVFDWSAEVSRQIATISEMPVFDGVSLGLEKLREASDLIVVSQTTEEALVREWRNAQLEEFIDVIAGAELGSKAESLTRAAVGRYSLDKIVMVGDAPGDLEAAQSVGCLFFPILPGGEVASWTELLDTALPRIQAGTFAGAYQEDLIERFNAVLSPTPPWE
ncbi:MAG: HAD hydrolase-like protein [Kiritimatiellales bacterium]|nr:HAD hydrolase-like protein [Kiritimatiellota bacterium]MBL7011725.1 HAD hydrolase-like protein [Kiritimatiellales bacterium]